MTATLLSVTGLRLHIETALGDEALQRLLDSCEQDIDDNCGPLPIDETYDTPEERTEWFTRSWNEKVIYTRQDCDSVVSVTEYTTSSDLSDEETELVEGEEFWVDGNAIRRKDGGRFGRRVKVIYVPKDARARRRTVLIQLVKLEINADPGTAFEGGGSWQVSNQDYETQRQHLLWSLCPPPVFA